ncbi:SF1B family DNA helicase RecD2 [Streptococcus sp. DD13]|uniref:SF1B family DNA helicase RecD2 n=1 Tax=Streptococcus sp. DD13 TaxID=1777881 RepID=UPI00079B56E9|nr:ATP-dependent RecD-like DNA helicase [Streptococcus sp. DD13]KXT77973.1 RecD-like DNA helicase YrrC [Streptococcus sp. DD13]
MNEIYITGSIDRIIFENPSNFFKILLIDIDESNTEIEDYEIIVTGTLAEVFEGESYTFYGQLVTHPKYGLQLQLTRYERLKPSQAGLVTYFSSDHFKGIGRKTAEKIIELYGDDPIDKILAQPDQLKSIAGLSEKTRQAFLHTLRSNYGTEQIIAKLAEYGIPNKYAFKIQDHYKEETLSVIKENPYQLVEDIEGMGFTIVDKIAEGLGIESQSSERFRAGLIHCLLQASIDRGDTYVEARDLLELTLTTLEEARPVELDPVALTDELTQLLAEGKIQQIGSKLFSNSLYYAEEGIYRQLTRLLEKASPSEIDRDSIIQAIETIEQASGITYDGIQKEAMIQAIQEPLFILTGGPGTGKTTVINGIIAVYALLNRIDLTNTKEESPFLLAAPTGRAARRMNELTGLPSATLHRHLGLTEGQEESYREDYLDSEFIIVDEFSMVDTWLAYQLFSNISTNTKLLIVGDANQLPSVGPGQVLADLLRISRLPSLTLEKIYRQSNESTIVTLADQIRQGYLPDDFCDRKPDRSYFEAQSDQIPAMVERIVTVATNSGIASDEIQILAPMYRGAAGINTLNQSTQALLNPPQNGQIEFAYQEFRFRERDRVIHLVNDPEANVFNGDLGYITDLLPAKYTDSKQDEITIVFDGGEVTYPRNEWYKFTMAYAMSIHKSQGSEFQVVILPITRSSHRMLQRNLIYTAITRAKSKLILLGDYQAFDYAVHNTGTSRQTYLKERFLASSEEDKQDKKATAQSPTKEPSPPVKRKETSSDSQIAPSLAKDRHAFSPTPDPAKTPQNQAATSPSHQTQDKTNSFLLTPQNFQSIDPMIGITADDLAQFFKF